MKLYNYFRSSASYRVRIALELKGLAPDIVQVHLGKGEQRMEEFLSLSPQGLVPVLEDGEVVLSQSLAIIEYLEELYPEPRLLPGIPSERAHVRELALSVACDIHPLNNLRVLQYLTADLCISEEDKLRWYRHWIKTGLMALEEMLVESPLTGSFCFRDQPTLADICLIPQLYNARRFECPLEEYPTILGIEEACLHLPAFTETAPKEPA